MKLLKQGIYQDPSSIIDKIGNIYWYKDNVYRGIKKEYADFYKELILSPNFQSFTKNGLVETSISEDNFLSNIDPSIELTLKHKTIGFRNYPVEWSLKMFIEAAKITLKLEKILNENNLHLKDMHGWNIMFDNYNPIFIDIGSISHGVPERTNSRILEFIENFIIPIKLLSKLKYDKFYYYMLGKQFWTNTRLKKYKLILMKKIHQLNSFDQIDEFLSTIEYKIKSTLWSNYEQLKNGGLTPKQAIIFDLLDSLSINNKTLLDMGTNQGLYSIQAIKFGYNVVAFDYDDIAISKLFIQIQKENINKITSLRMNFLQPTPLHGKSPTHPAATDRFQCDGTLVLAMIHHLIFTHNSNFNQIARIINDFTDKFCIIEYIPRDDIFVKNWLRPEHYWYTEDNFINTMMEFFDNFKEYPSDPYPRKIFLFQKNTVKNNLEKTKEIKK